MRLIYIFIYAPLSIYNRNKKISINSKLVSDFNNNDLKIENKFLLHPRFEIAYIYPFNSD